MRRRGDDSATRSKVKEAYLDLHRAFRDDVVTPWLGQWRRHLYAPCIRLLVKARDHAALERRQRNVLSFNDLLIRTEAVLRQNAGVRRALQDKYRWLFVDEFQDTDPLQADIMFLLANPEQSGTESGPPRGVFVVGDPKQSIYRFRRADIDIYNHVRRLIGGEGDQNVVPLTTNFRSVPSLCEWANEVSSQSFRWQATPTPRRSRLWRLSQTGWLLGPQIERPTCLR